MLAARDAARHRLTSFLARSSELDGLGVVMVMRLGISVSRERRLARCGQKYEKWIEFEIWKGSAAVALGAMGALWLDQGG